MPLLTKEGIWEPPRFLQDRYNFLKSQIGRRLEGVNTSAHVIARSLATKQSQSSGHVPQSQVGGIVSLLSAARNDSMRILCLPSSMVARNWLDTRREPARSMSKGDSGKVKGARMAGENRKPNRALIERVDRLREKIGPIGVPVSKLIREGRRK